MSNWWADTLQVQQVVETLSPATALSVGFQVDSDALPPALIDAIKAGEIDLDTPAVTLELLKLKAVVAVIGKVISGNNKLASVGVTCALCHSIVDDSVALGIGKRLDGWANRTLDVGAIIRGCGGLRRVSHSTDLYGCPERPRSCRPSMSKSATLESRPFTNSTSSAARPLFRAASKHRRKTFRTWRSEVRDRS